MATKQEIINKFHLFIDNTTELSETEESDLFDKIYLEVTSNRPWEFLKTTVTDTFTTNSDTLPDDFDSLYENNMYTDNSIGVPNNASPSVLWVTLSGANDITPFQMVNKGDNRQYRNMNGFAYVDVVTNTINLTGSPSLPLPYELDYIFVPPTLALDESPIFPARFHDIIYHGMCIDSFIIQQSDKAKSYAPENQKRYNDYMKDMAFWNSRLILN